MLISDIGVKNGGEWGGNGGDKRRAGYVGKKEV